MNITATSNEYIDMDVLHNTIECAKTIISQIGDKKYSARAGYAEEAYKYEFIGSEYEDSENKKDNSDSIISVTGGTFVNYDPANSATENPEQNR